MNKEMTMMTAGGMGYTNCAYGFGMGNGGGLGAAGFGGVFTFPTEEPAAMTAPGPQGAPMLGLELATYEEPTREQELAELAGFMGW